MQEFEKVNWGHVVSEFYCNYVLMHNFSVNQQTQLHWHTTEVI